MKLSTKLLAILATVGIATTGALAITRTAEAAVAGSGLGWTHGAYMDHNPGNISLFQTDTGKNLDAVEGFAAENDISNISWQAAGAKLVTDQGGKLILAVPLWASGSSVSNTSKNTADFTALRNNLVAAGISNKTIIRLGWEMNIPFGYWTVTSTNRTAWVAAFKNAVNILRANNSGIQIAFNPNEGVSQSPAISTIATLATELTDYFEWIGIDFYNWDASMNTAAGWNTRLNESYGVKGWLNWIVNDGRGKGFAVPEWGGMASNTQSDDTYYATQMINLFSNVSKGTQTIGTVTYPAIKVFEAYFNEPGFDYSPAWAGTITRYRLNGDNQTGTPRSAQLPVLGTAYKNALAAVGPVVVPSSSAPTVSPTPSVSSSGPSCN